MSNIPISEVFYTLQWEWRNTGKPVIFIRFWWCNKRCNFCDTPYAVTDNSEMKQEDLFSIIDEIDKYPSKHIVFTWWEPALFEKQIAEIQDYLSANRYWYTWEIETNGSIELKNYYDQVNVSYKTSNSWVPKYELKALSTKYDYKFVVADEYDFEEVEEIIEEYNLPKENIWLMPLWVTEDSQKNLLVAKYCMEKWYRYCQRTHILLFGNKRWV